MQLNYTSHEPINNLCNTLMSNRLVRFQTLIRLKNDPNFIEEHFLGIVSEDCLLRFIQKCRKVRSLQRILPSIMDCVNDDCITDEIVSQALSYKNEKTKEGIIIALSHKHLSTDMLRRLCKTNICFECYFELAIAAYMDTKASAYDVKEAIDFLIKSPFSGMISNLIDEMRTIQISDISKRDMLKTYAQMYDIQ